MHLASSESTHVAQIFHNEGYAVLAYDQEGHGRSKGSKGNIVSLEDYATDCENFIIKAKSNYDSKIPIFLLGESMGGALCIMVSVKRPDLIRGVILYAPAIGIDPKYEPMLIKIIKFMASCFCGGCKLKKLDQTLASRNPHYPGFYKDNPEIYSGKVNARTGAAIIKNIENGYSKFLTLTTPLILFQGGEDKLIDAQRVKDYYENVKSTDKKLVFYDEMYHCVFHEPEIDEIIKTSVEWCNSRLDFT